MKNPLRTAALAVALSAAGAASAQQQPGHVRVGVGVGLPTSELTSFFAMAAPGTTAGLLPAQIYVPVDFTPSFRVEPEFGFISIHQDGGSDASYYTFGAGAFWMLPLTASAHTYLGGRAVVGLERSTANAGGVETRTRGTDLYLAAAFGGEVLPHPRIGVGAEAQVGWWQIGDRTSASITEPGGSSLQTQGVIFVRVYLN
jgi:hypothetical protein